MTKQDANLILRELATGENELTNESAVIIIKHCWEKWNEEGSDWRPRFTAAEMIDAVLQRAELGFLIFHLSGSLQYRLQEQMKDLDGFKVGGDGFKVRETHEWFYTARRKFLFMPLDRGAE